MLLDFRYKREEVKIQAWENHEKTKAEMEMRRIEVGDVNLMLHCLPPFQKLCAPTNQLTSPSWQVRTERMRSRAEEKHANKLAAARRIAEERRAKQQDRLDERVARTSERADYIRKTGLLPTSFFSFKLWRLVMNGGLFTATFLLHQPPLLLFWLILLCFSCFVLMSKKSWKLNFKLKFSRIVQE